MARTRPLRIALLGTSGSGKTTYLYRLVAAYLESPLSPKPLSKEAVAGLSAAAFLELVAANGIQVDATTADFLRRAHASVKASGAVRATELDGEDPLSLSLRFTHEQIWLTTEDIPGHMVRKMAGELQATALSNRHLKDIVGGDAGHRIFDTIRKRLRDCDGILYFHAPELAENGTGDSSQAISPIPLPSGKPLGEGTRSGDTVMLPKSEEVEVEVEGVTTVRAVHAVPTRQVMAETPTHPVLPEVPMGLGAHERESMLLLEFIARVALYQNSDPFLPLVVVFTKADTWRDPETVRGQRDRHLGLYWEILRDFHETDFSHPFWRQVLRSFSSGRNFTSISSKTGGFAELLAPITNIQELSEDLAGYTFWGGGLQRLVMVFLTVLVVGGIVAGALLFAPQVEPPSVAHFEAPADYYTWEQRLHDNDGWLAALADVSRHLKTLESQMEGDPRNVGMVEDYVEWLRVIKRMQRQDQGVLEGPITEELKRVEEQLHAWLSQAAGRDEWLTPGMVPADLPDAWFRVAEVYADAFGRVLEQDSLTTVRRVWREGMLAKFKRDLAEYVRTYPPTDPPSSFYAQLRNRLSTFQRAYLSGTGGDVDYTWLPADPRSEEDQGPELLEAQQWARDTARNGQQLALYVDRFVVAEDDPTFTPTRFLNARFFSGRTQLGSQFDFVQGETTGGQRIYRAHYQQDHEAEGGVVFPFGWTPGDTIQLRIWQIIGASSVDVFDRDLKVWAEAQAADAETEGSARPWSLPGWWVEAFAADVALRGTVRVPQDTVTYDETRRVVRLRIGMPLEPGRTSDLVEYPRFLQDVVRLAQQTPPQEEDASTPPEDTAPPSDGE